MNSIQPRKQRKNLYNAPLHKRRKWLASHLAEDLMLKYNKRSVPVVRGDTVKVVRGNFKNHVDKVREVDLVKQVIEVEGVVTTKVDGSKVPRPIHPSNVIITKLNLTDPRRREKLERGLSEEAKKEIEMEAKRQIEEERLEEERRKEEEARKAAEAKEAQEEPEEQAKQPEEKAAEEAVEEPEGKPEKVEEVEEKTEEEPEEAESKEEPEPVEEPKKAEEEQVEEEAEGKKKDGGAAEDLNNKDIEG